LKKLKIKQRGKKNQQTIGSSGKDKIEKKYGVGFLSQRSLAELATNKAPTTVKTN
jgi:hypothetical protein